MRALLLLAALLPSAQGPCPCGWNVVAPQNGQRGRRCADHGADVADGASCDMVCDPGYALSGVQPRCQPDKTMSSGTLRCTGRSAHPHHHAHSELCAPVGSQRTTAWLARLPATRAAQQRLAAAPTSARTAMPTTPRYERSTRPTGQQRRQLRQSGLPPQRAWIIRLGLPSQGRCRAGAKRWLGRRCRSLSLAGCSQE